MTWSSAPPCKSPSSTATSCMLSSLSSSSYILPPSSTRRRRFTAFCLHHNSNSSSSSPSSSSSSSSSSRNRDTGAINKVAKSTNLDTSCGLKRNKSEEATALGDCAESQVSWSRNGPLKKQTLGASIKALFGRSWLWRRRSKWRMISVSRKFRSIVLLNLITIVYASNIPVVKEVEAIVDPAVFTVVRFAVCAIPFLPFVIRARDDVHTRNAGIELGFWLSLGYLMQAIGLLTSDAGRASFISMFTVIVVPLLDGMLGALVPPLTWLGALMSVLGVALLESSGSPPSIGDLMNFLGAVFFGIHMLRTQHISRSSNNSNFLALLGYEVCVVTLISTLWYFVGGSDGGIQASYLSSWAWTTVWHSMAVFPWIPALYTGLFSTALCLWIEMAAMCDVSATETAIIYGLEPVWGAGFAWFLLGERWGATGWIGAALVIGGSLMVQIFGLSVATSGEDDKNKVSPTDYR